MVILVREVTSEVVLDEKLINEEPAVFVDNRTIPD